MPIPAVFIDAMRRRDFWVQYLLTEGAEWPEFGRRCHVAAPVGGGYEIVVGLSKLLYVTDLYLRRPGVKKLYWMGRNDLAEWPRDVLRWEETLLITQAAARLNPDFAASDVLLVLLSCFTPLTAENNRKQIYARMRKAFVSLGVLSTSLITRCVRHCLPDATGLSWRRDAKRGWVFDLYPRSPDGSFPYKHFAGLIEAAKRTCEQPARRARKRRPSRALTAPLPPRPKAPPIVLPDEVYTRAELTSVRFIFLGATPTAEPVKGLAIVVPRATSAAQRRSAERSLKALVQSALAAMDAITGAQAVKISKGQVSKVMTMLPEAKRKELATFKALERKREEQRKAWERKEVEKWKTRQERAKR